MHCGLCGKGTGDHVHSDLITTLIDNEVELRVGLTSRAARITSTANNLCILPKTLCALVPVSVGRNKKVRGLK